MVGRFKNADLPQFSAAFAVLAMIALLVLWSTGGIGDAMTFGGIANLSAIAGLICLGTALED
jgi:hypothetical protein